MISTASALLHSSCDRSLITLFDKISSPPFFTSPLNIFKSEKDGDGFTDGEEFLLYGTSPNNDDTDDDGISDYFEIANGTAPLEYDQ